MVPRNTNTAVATLITGYLQNTKGFEFLNDSINSIPEVYVYFSIYVYILLKAVP